MPCVARHSDQDVKSHWHQALSIALQHPLVAADQQNICRLLQVCKGWRAAMQQSAACSTSVCLEVITAPPLDSLTKLGNFAPWLPKHAGLVHSISIVTPRLPWEHGMSTETKSYAAIGGPLLECSLMAAAHGRAEAAAAATAAAVAAVADDSAPAAAAPSLASKPLRLHSYRSDLLYSPGIVAALPAGSLKELELEYPRSSHVLSSTASSAALAAALGRLTNLQQLRIVSRTNPLQPSTMAACGNLTRLTQLQLTNAATSNLQQLPASLVVLKLDAYGNARSPPVCVDLSHLTRLQHLQLLAAYGVRFSVGSSLPSQLVSLELQSTEAPAAAAFNITGLQLLQQLTINNSQDTPEKLQQLSKLPQLQHLELHYKYPSSALRAAPAWQHLRQLRSLSWFSPVAAVELQKLVQVLPYVGRATSLAKLSVVALVRVWDEEEQAEVAAEGRVAVCEHLVGLTGLQDLKLLFSGASTAAQDALHLTALTGLTKLDLSQCPTAVDTTVAAALACELTQLQWLGLQQLSGTAVLPVIRKLSGLRHLSLRGMPADAATEGLRFLTRLSQLTQLEGFEECEQSVLDGYWEAIRRHQQQMRQQA